MRRIILPAIVLAGLVGCASQTAVDELEAKITQLEGKITQLESAKGATAAAKPAASSDEEAAAAKLYSEVTKLIGEGKFDQAKGKVDELLAKYSNTKAGSRGPRLANEIGVVGTKVDKLETTSWFTGADGDIDLANGTTLLVFFESWCPHCKREMPELKEVATEYTGKLDVVGLTKVTRSSTDEKVAAFIAEHELNYPVAKEDGSMSRAFAVSGIPAAAVVKDGQIVWRGHPNSLAPATLTGFIN